MKPTAILSVSSLLALACATPLTKRAAPETIYLSNCADINSSGTAVSASSEVDYYTAGHDSQKGERPDDICIVTNKNGFKHWEGSAVSCTFADSGVTFTANVESNGASQPVGTKAGTGSNGFHTYNIFRDNDRVLYSAPSTGSFSGDTYQCKSVYYALRVSVECKGDSCSNASARPKPGAGYSAAKS